MINAIVLPEKMQSRKDAHNILLKSNQNCLNPMIEEVVVQKVVKKLKFLRMNVISSILLSLFLCLNIAAFSQKIETRFNVVEVRQLGYLSVDSTCGSFDGGTLLLDLKLISVKPLLFCKGYKITGVIFEKSLGRSICSIEMLIGNTLDSTMKISMLTKKELPCDGHFTVKIKKDQEVYFYLPSYSVLGIRIKANR